MRGSTGILKNENQHKGLFRDYGVYIGGILG